MEEKLRSFLKTGADWARLRTSVPGIFVLKLPPFRGSPARLAVELNPVDEAGRPTKRRGLIIRTARACEEYEQLLTSDKLKPLIENVEAVNPAERKRVAKPGEDVLTI